MDLKALQDEVTRDRDVNQSAVTLITGLAAQLEAAKNDPAAIQALADELRSNSDALAGAVTANTPAA